ncbi:MAG: dienelactone hydrolase family protein [Lachnospiraceae bacterium]|nr:dienelactone hydrolase family protein [Lachnospiraceae bacterium]
MRMKKIMGFLLAAGLTISSVAPTYAAELYKRHQSNEATFETLQEAHANAPAFIMGEYPGRTYVGDPALDEYPENTTFIYRSAGMLNTTTGGPRMHTNLMVYTDQNFEDKDAALAFLNEMGLTKMADEATGSVVLVTPIDPEKGFGDADQYAYYQLQQAMCNVGFVIRGENSTYYADAGYFGGVTNRYLIGIDGGATFINNYVSPTLDYVGRIAGMLLVGGDMEKIQNVASCVPVWLVNASEQTVEKYAKGNETDSTGRNGDDLLYYNSDHPLQQVISTTTDEVDLAETIQKAYNDLFIKCFRVPVVKAGLNTASTLYRNYNWNQTPYSLGARNAIINGVTPDGIHVMERQDEELLKDFATEKGEYVTTWYEFLPDEMVSGEAQEHSIPLIVVNHGGGDDPIQAVDELGWLKLAGEERFAILAERHTSEDLNAAFGDPSPWNTLSEAMPVLVRNFLEEHPEIDPERVYVTGYSMGGGATNRCVFGDASLFAAAVNNSGTPIEHTPEQEEQFKELDMPMMLTTCTYDTHTHFDSANGIIAEDFQNNINWYLGFNEMDPVEFDFDTYEMSGFKGDVYRETMINDEYPNYTWFLNNDEGVPMVGLSIIEFIPHGLYQEYAGLAWNWMKHFTRDAQTKEIHYNPYVN